MEWSQDLIDYSLRQIYDYTINPSQGQWNLG